MTFLHVYLFGFAGTMGLFAWVYKPIIDRENMLEYTIVAMIASACWPLILIAALVALTDQ